MERKGSPASGYATWKDIGIRFRRGSQPRLVDQVCDVVRQLRHSIRTEQGYVDGVRRFILFRGKLHPYERGAVAGRRF